MKKKNALILVLVFFILLTPSYVLLIHALETSNFPERERVSEVEYRFLGSESESPENALPVRLSVDSDEVDLIYAIFAGAKRVARSEMPDRYAAYRLTFRGDDLGEEILTLYVSRADYSVYIRTSEYKLYLFELPRVTHLRAILPPSAATFTFEGKTVVSAYDYPENVNGPQAVAEISLSRWEYAERFTFPELADEVSYTLYTAENELILSTDDVGEIIARNPSKVLMDVTCTLEGGITVSLRYYLRVQ